MEADILLAGLLLVVIFMYVFWFRNGRKKEHKSYYLKRFLRNKDQYLRFIKEIESLSVQPDFQDVKPFSDKEITLSEYLDQLKLKFESNFSNRSYKVLKKNKLSHSQRQEYTKKLMEQSEDLYLIEVDLGVLNKTLKKAVS